MCIRDSFISILLEINAFLIIHLCRYSADLPQLETTSDVAIDLDVLEMTEMIGSFRFSKKRKTSVDETEAKYKFKDNLIIY